MTTASITEIEASFSAYLNASEKGPVVVTRKGKPVAVLLAVTDEEELERLLMAHSPRLQAILEAAQKRIRAGKGIPNDEFWKLVDADAKKRKKTRQRLPS